ncbi:MAG: hypothetical protein ACLFU5_01465 [Thermoplasmata archaeon]
MEIAAKAIEEDILEAINTTGTAKRAMERDIIVDIIAGMDAAADADVTLSAIVPADIKKVHGDVSGLKKKREKD